MATPPTTNEPRINDRIRAREVRLVGADGAQVGIKALPEALAMARALDLDLVEVAAAANPPVCRIMDYGKYKYEAAQKAKESRRKATNISVKEMKYRPKIGHGDFDTKTRKVEEFLGEGHKVKVTIMFRGREMQHPELGRKILNQVADAVSNVGVVEVYPKQDGRNMIMVLGPDKKAQVQIKKPRTDAPVVQSPVSASVSSPTAPPAVAQPAVVAEAPAAPVTEAPPATVATPHDAV